MAIPVEQTLGELRAELSRNLGFQGQGAILNKGLLDSFLQRAQQEVYRRMVESRTMTIYATTVGAEQRYIDYPTGLDADQVHEIRLDRTGSEDWVSLVQGIDTSHHRRRDDRQYPTRFDRHANQIELWRIPSSVYNIEIEGIPSLGSFVADGDRCTVDAEGVFLIALAKGKAHYNRPDKDEARADANRWVLTTRARAHGPRRHYNTQDNRRRRGEPARPLLVT